MAQETEIKLRIEDAQELRQKLKRLGAKIIVPRTREVNVLFDTPESGLKRREALLRIRTETAAAERNGAKGRGERVLLTFKRPLEAGAKPGAPERHKTREELELEASDGETLANIFQALGLREWFRYEKFRTTYRPPARARWAKGLLIELDETPIGLFVELEGPPRAIDRAAKELGFTDRAFIVANYIELYRKYCRDRGEQPTRMVFANDRARRAASKSKKIPELVGFS